MIPQYNDILQVYCHVSYPEVMERKANAPWEAKGEEN